jgi:hypothetical protein
MARIAPKYVQPSGQPSRAPETKKTSKDLAKLKEKTQRYMGMVGLKFLGAGKPAISKRIPFKSEAARTEHAAGHALHLRSKKRAAR